MRGWGGGGGGPPPPPPPAPPHPCTPAPALITQKGQQQPEYQQGMRQRGDVADGLIAERDGGEDQGRGPGEARAPVAQPVGQRPDKGHVRAVEQHQQGVVGERAVGERAAAKQTLEQTQDGEDDRPVVAVFGRTGKEADDRLPLHPGEVAGRVVVEVGQPQRAPVEPDGGEGGEGHRQKVVVEARGGKTVFPPAPPHPYSPAPLLLLNHAPTGCRRPNPALGQDARAAGAHRRG